MLTGLARRILAKGSFLMHSRNSCPVNMAMSGFSYLFKHQGERVRKRAEVTKGVEIHTPTHNTHTHLQAILQNKVRAQTQHVPLEEI